MKVQPPVGPPPGTTPEAIGPSAPGKEATGASFAEKLRGSAQAEGTGAAAGATHTQASSEAAFSAHVDAIAAELRAGTITSREQATARIVDRVLDAKFGGKVPPEALTQMKGAVAAQLAADPHLADRLDALLRRAQSE